VTPVLVLRALGLGDGLTAVPALRGLRRLAGDRPLVLACAHPVAELLRRNAVVDRVHPTPGLGGPPPGPAVGRHTAVNLHGRGPRSHALLLAGRPDSLVAFACPEAGVTGPAWDGAEHEVARWCRLVGSAGGACDRNDLRLGEPGDRSGPVVVHPGAASASRRWPVDRWAAVARALATGGHPVVVTGSGPDERRDAAGIVAAAGLPAAADRSGALDLFGLADLVRDARLVLSGDTGVAHLATATGTPSVTLFGPVSPARWGPPAADDHVAIWHGGAGTAGDPHGTAPDPTLLEVRVDEVVAAAAALLAAGSSGGRQALPQAGQHPRQQP
jgi:ADP-heptose:LPS heptosyltransferase